MKPQTTSIWDSLQDHEVYHRSLVLFPYPKLPSISNPSAEFSDFSSLGFKPLVGDTSSRSFIKTKVLRDQGFPNPKSVRYPGKQDHRINSKFSESQKIRFLTKVKDEESVGETGKIFKTSQTQCSPVENVVQSVNNNMRRTYDKQSKLKELIKK